MPRVSRQSTACPNTHQASSPVDVEAYATRTIRLPWERGQAGEGR